METSTDSPVTPRKLSLTVDSVDDAPVVGSSASVKGILKKEKMYTLPANFDELSHGDDEVMSHVEPEQEQLQIINARTMFNMVEYIDDPSGEDARGLASRKLLFLSNPQVRPSAH